MIDRIECVRKDGSTLPARISLNIGMLDKHITIAAFIRDVTSEVKAQRLLALEKARSDELLLNILPSHVATRLKAGEQSFSD